VAQRFEFVDVPAAPVPSLLRGLSAPARLVCDHGDEALALLASHDSDAVNRWDAAQRLYANAILRVAHAHRSGLPLVLPPSLTQVVRRLLDDDASDASLRALALQPPDAAYVASLEPVIDPDAIGAAMTFVARSVAAEAREAFERAYQRHRVGRAYVWEPRAAAARSLSNLCLRFLGALDDDAAHAAAIDQFDSADNMTDSIGALRALRDSLSPARDAIYRQFEAKWHGEALALDKWFELQAQSARGDTLEVVRALIRHPRFNARNPNRVRSLVGAFALRNFTRFHAPDGAGYTFAADQVRELDPVNPQLASAIAGAFNLWKRFSEPRRTQMKRSLEQIARTRGLSPDVGEVVTVTLAG
jgi:aminopeptidase N